MPRFLDENNLSNAQPRGGMLSAPSGVVRLSGGEAIGNAVSDLGRTGQNLANEQFKNIDEFQLAEAKSLVLQETVNFQKQLSEDQDYGTYEERYLEHMQKVGSKASGMINNAQLRQRFDQSVEDDITRGKETVYEKAKAKERDIGRASLDQMIDENLQAALTAPDEETRTKLLDSANVALVGAYQRGYISAEEWQEKKKNAGEYFALNKLSSMSGADQLSLINAANKGEKNLAAAIPYEKRMKLKEAAQEGNYRAVALEKTDTILGKYPGDYEGQVNAARTINDPKVRDKVLQEIDAQYGREQKFKSEQNDLREQRVMDVFRNGGTVNDVPVEDWLALPESDRIALEKYQRVQSGLEPADSTEALVYYDRIATDYGRDPQSIRNYTIPQLMANVPREKLTKVLEWRQKAMEGQRSPEITEGHITKLVDGTMDQLGIRTGGKHIKGDARKALLRESIEQEVQAYTSLNGRKPSYNDLVDIRDRLVQGIELDRWGSNPTRYSFELQDEDLQDVVVPDNLRDDILTRIQRKYPDRAVTEEEIRAIYIQSLGR